MLFSCKTRSIDPVLLPLGEDYYPIKSGNFIVYSIWKKEKVAGGFDVSQYLLKEIVADTFITGGEVSYRIERYIKNESQDLWPEQPDSVWALRFSNNRFIKTESNIPFIKLVIPVKEGATWDGNSLNTYGSDQYDMNNVNEPATVLGKVYNQTLTILQEVDTTNLVHRKLRVEKFAKGVGLIYKKTENLTLDFNTGDTTSGYIYLQELAEKNY